MFAHTSWGCRINITENSASGNLFKNYLGLQHYTFPTFCLSTHSNMAFLILQTENTSSNSLSFMKKGSPRECVGFLLLTRCISFIPQNHRTLPRVSDCSLRPLARWRSTLLSPLCPLFLNNKEKNLELQPKKKKKEGRGKGPPPPRAKLNSKLFYSTIALPFSN